MSEPKNGTAVVTAKQAATWSAVRSLADAMQLAEVVAKSGAIPECRNAGQALLKVLAGAEMGFGPFASLVDVHIIEGKPSIGAHLRAASIQRSDRFDYDVAESTEQVCSLNFFERRLKTGGLVRKALVGWECVGNVRITFADAERFGWTRGANGIKRNWKASAQDMLFARCISRGYRQYCPSLTGGVLAYDPDELDNREPIDAEIVERPTIAPPAPTAVVSAPLPAPPARPAPIGDQGPQPPPVDYIKRIKELAAQAGYDDNTVSAKLVKMYGFGNLLDLDAGQAQAVICGLEITLATKRKAVTA